MKRIISVLLVFAMISVSTFTVAEEKEGLWGQIGGFFEDVAAGAGDVLDKAGDTLNKAGEAVGEAANSAGQKIGDLWSSAEDKATNAWTWISEFTSEQGDNVSQAATEVITDLKSWVNTSGANAQEQLKAGFATMAEKIGVAGETATQIWDSILEYAKEKDITPVILVKLALAVMAKIYLGKISKTVNSIADAEILSSAKTIIGWFCDNQIDSEKAAVKALELIQEFLK